MTQSRSSFYTNHLVVTKSALLFLWVLGVVVSRDDLVSDLTDYWGPGIRPDRRSQAWVFGLNFGPLQVVELRTNASGRFSGGEYWGFWMQVGGTLVE